MAIEIPDWFESHMERFQDINDAPIYLGCEQYVEKALECGASLVRLNGYPTYLVMPVSDGQDIAVLGQDVGYFPIPDPTHTTFIATERCEEISIFRQCKGIPIWEPDKILESIHCVRCEIPLHRFSDMYRGYSGVVCKYCSRRSNERYGHEM